jgi:hypothetical protein
MEIITSSHPLASISLVLLDFFSLNWELAPCDFPSPVRSTGFRPGVSLDQPS